MKFSSETLTFFYLEVFLLIIYDLHCDNIFQVFSDSCGISGPLSRGRLSVLSAVFLEFGHKFFLKLEMLLGALLFLFENQCEYYKKLVSRSWPLLFALTCFLYIHCPIPQQIRPQTTVHICILQDYSNVRFGLNMNQKRHTLLIVYTILV